MTLTYERFIDTVQEEAGISRDEAERATVATLETLGERISEGEGRQLAAELPPELEGAIVEPGEAEPFDIEEFRHRIAQREGVDEPAAEHHAVAVFEALRRTVSRKEIEDAAAQLSEDLRSLLVKGTEPPEAGRRPRSEEGEEFYRRVAELAGSDEEAARRATDAALEALADRITGGEVDDLMKLVPPELHPPLRRGKAKSNGAARPLTLEQFIHEIAELEGTDEEQAQRDARMVFHVLREIVGENELHDVFEQVPDDYAFVLGPRP